MANHHEIANFIWSIADLLRGPYRPPQYERVMLPMTVLRRFDCVLAPTKDKVLREYERRKGGKPGAEGLDKALNRAAGQRFHNHSPLTFEKLKGDPDHIDDVQAIDKTLGRPPQLDWNDVWRAIQALLAAVGEVGA
jgi:type I restriction enzyme M protein